MYFHVTVVYVQWECKAELDSKYQFGRLQISCEGYEYPDDPYILRGSCGVREIVMESRGQSEAICSPLSPAVRV